MIPKDVAFALYWVRRRAERGDPLWVALRDELARLYDAANERRPEPLGKPRRDGRVEYRTEPAEYWGEVSQT